MLALRYIFSDSHACMLKHIQCTHVENDLLVCRTMLMGLATTAADERNKNRSKEITITLMDALISILVLSDSCKLLILPCLSIYIMYILTFFYHYSNKFCGRATRSMQKNGSQYMFFCKTFSAMNIYT